MTSEPGMVWTLIESFAQLNKDKYKNKDFVENFPVNENNFNWIDYRLSLSVMQHIKSHSTHWRATCNYDKDGLVKTDYIRGRISDIDIITYSEGNGCFNVMYVNVMGTECSNCTVHMRQVENVHIFTGSYGGYSFGCMLDLRDGTGGSQRFGFYHTVNPAHRCSNSSLSTTQWWLGSNV